MVFSRSGYTLPVFACASAVAALRHLQGYPPASTVTIDLLDPPQMAEIPVEQVARLGENAALAITRSDPGDNLDLTRHTPVWALVQVNPTGEEGEGAIAIEGGEGIGRQEQGQGKAAIYRYAQRLLRENLQGLQRPGEDMTVTLILPEGQRLAARTSNAAFGVVEGLSLLGTRGISQPLSGPGQLAACQEALAAKARGVETLAFCIGENGLDLARRAGIPEARLLKVANWLGPLLVAAALEGVGEILLLGYHGKLLKLAGGIFHTHHHLADGRQEILTAHCALAGLSGTGLQDIFAAQTAEAALQLLRSLDKESGTDWVGRVYGAIGAAIDRRSQAYIRQHGEREVRVGCALFDRDRQIFCQSQAGEQLLARLLDFRLQVGID